jgi:hypothetical protein
MVGVQEFNGGRDVMSEEAVVKADGEGGGADGGSEALEKVLVLEQAKNKALVAEVIALEDEVVNRVMADFDAVVSDETRGFWRGQILANREVAVLALTELANAKRALVDGAGGVRRPMHNRAQSRPVVPAVGGGGAAGGETDERAARIRNRAHEISRADRVAFSVAFRRAEMEVAGG